MKRFVKFFSWFNPEVRVFISNYIGRLLVFAVAVLGGMRVFSFDVYGTVVLLSLVGSALLILRPTLIVFSAMVLLLSAPFYYLSGAVISAERVVVHVYYLLLIVAVRHGGSLIWDRSRLLRKFGEQVRRREQSGYYALRRAVIVIVKWCVHITKKGVQKGQLGYYALRKAVIGVVKWGIRITKTSIRSVWRNKAELAISIMLFCIPFFWFKNGEADFGGDSSRLYFYDPLNWLKSMGLYEINASGFDSPNFFMIPFLLLLEGMKRLFDNSAPTMLAIFNGMLLSGAFLSVYGTIRILLSHSQERQYRRVAAIMGALLFVLSPIVMFSWQKALYTFNQIAVYPLVIWLWLLYIRFQRSIFILIAALVTFVFSVNFSLYAITSFSAFFLIAFPLITIYALLIQRGRIWGKGFLVFLMCFLLLNWFQLFPQIVSVLNPSSNIYESLFTETGQLNRGLNYFQGVRPMVRFIYNVVGFPQYHLYTITSSPTAPLVQMLFSFGVQILYLFIIFPFIIVWGFMLSVKERAGPMRKIFLLMVSLFLVILFFMTANIFGPWGPKAYAALFHIPGFSMFRSFYGVFAIISVYILALTFGIAFHYVLIFLPRRSTRVILTGGLLALLAYSAIPFFRGDIVNVIMSDTKGVKLSNRFRPSYEKMISYVRNDATDARIVAVPLNAGGYQIVDGQFGGAYIGPSPLSVLAGRQVFGGLAAFEYPRSFIFSQNFFLDRLHAKDYRTLNRLFSLLNVGYIFYNSNSDVYRDKFIGWPYSKEVWDAFPLFPDFDAFIRHMGYTPIYGADTYVLYHNPNYFLPHLYIPRALKKVASEEQMKEIMISDSAYDLYSAFYILGTNADAIIKKFPDAIADRPALQIRKINPTKYLLRVSNITSSFPLVLSEPFHPGWRLAFESPKKSFQGIKGIFLPTQRLFVDEQYHTRANQYANGWWIDLEYMRDRFNSHLRRNSAGGYTMDIELVFAPQDKFYPAASISLVALVMTVFGVLWLLSVRVLGYAQKYNKKK